jgi:hypothetical protein
VTQQNAPPDEKLKSTEKESTPSVFFQEAQIQTDPIEEIVVVSNNEIVERLELSKPTRNTGAESQVLIISLIPFAVLLYIIFGLPISLLKAKFEGAENGSVKNVENLKKEK